MPTAAESASGGSQLQAALDAGIDQLAKDQVVTFQSYTKVALAPDASIFWVANGQSQSAKGSLHFSTDSMQDEDQSLGSNEFIFTSEAEVTSFNTIAPTMLLIGSWPFADGSNLQIVFSRRGRFYEESQLWHYSGRSVYPAMQSQIINSMADLPTGPIVSNSLPIWLLQTTVGESIVPVYPSFLVPQNIVPPYIVAHVEPGRTTALQGAPFFEYTSQQIGGTGFFEFAASQICRDDVRLTMYGFTNAMAWQYYWTLYTYSLVGFGETPTFGFASSPAIQDEKRTQNEINALAMKKTLTFEANYYQGTANAAAYRLILSASMSVQIQGGLNPIGAFNVVQDDQTINAVGTVT
jgi:hypothetical protein